MQELQLRRHSLNKVSLPHRMSQRTSKYATMFRTLVATQELQLRRHYLNKVSLPHRMSAIGKTITAQTV